MRLIAVGEKKVSLQEIRSRFEFVPVLFYIELRGGYSYGAWPRNVLITIEFKFMVPEWWHLVVFCTCRILSEGLIFVENFPLQNDSLITRGTHMDEPWRTSYSTSAFASEKKTCEWLMQLIEMTHCTYMNYSWHTYECDVEHKWMSHGTYIDESWHTYGWVMAHIWMSYGTRMDGSLHTSRWLIAHTPS